MVRRMRRPAPELQAGGGVAQCSPLDWVLVQMLSRLRPQAPISPAHGPTQSSSSRLLLIAKTPSAGEVAPSSFTPAVGSSQVHRRRATHPSPMVARFGRATSCFSWPEIMNLHAHRTQSGTKVKNSKCTGEAYRMRLVSKGLHPRTRALRAEYRNLIS